MSAVVVQFPGKAPEAAPERHPAQYAQDLSFMAFLEPKGTGINYWSVTPSGHYVTDWETGERLAKEYLDYIGRYPTHGHKTLLGSIVNDMILRGKAGREHLSGVEIGFLHSINGVTMATAAWLAGAR